MSISLFTILEHTAVQNALFLIHTNLPTLVMELCG